jgi:hypothetical protein
MSPIRHSLRSASRGAVLRVLVWVVSLVLLLAAGALTVFDWMLRQKYEPVLGQHRKETTGLVGFFCEQQAKLAADPWFHEPRTPGDAGPLLNAWVPWDPKPPLPRGSPLTLPAGLPQTGKDFEDWVNSSVDVSSLDFGWMRQLHAYDRWDIVENSPVPLPQRINWATMRIPRFVPLLMWSKFRLLHGLRTGAPTEAARDVRQLAWLAYRTETLLGGMVAVALLKAERQAYDSMKSPPADWHPMSLEQLDRMRAVLAAGPAFSQLSTPVEVARQSRSCSEPVARCMALTESSFFATYLRPLAEEQYRDVYAALATELAEQPCGTSLLKTLWERGVTVLEENPEPLIQSQVDWPNSLPGMYARRHMVGILLSVASPNFGKLHELRADLESGKYEQKKP